MEKIAVIMHKKNSVFPYYAVIQQNQKPHSFVAALCSITALGFGAIGNPENVAGYDIRILGGRKCLSAFFIQYMAVI